MATNSPARQFGVPPLDVCVEVPIEPMPKRARQTRGVQHEQLLDFARLLVALAGPKLRDLLLLDDPPFSELNKATQGRWQKILNSGRTFPDKEYERWRDAVAAIVQPCFPSYLLPLDCPVRVDRLYVLPRRKEDFRPSAPNGLIWCPTKPDADNCDKALFDALKWLWRDDSRVCFGVPFKCWAERNGEPRLELRIRTNLPEAGHTARTMGFCRGRDEDGKKVLQS